MFIFDVKDQLFVWVGSQTSSSEQKNALTYAHVSQFTQNFLTKKGAQCFSGRVLDLRPSGRGLEPHRRHCCCALKQDINPSSELVQHRKTRPFITERLLMGRKESNQTNRQIFHKVFRRSCCLFLFIIKWARQNLSLGVCKHQRCRTAPASVQSHQGLY